MCGSPPVDLIQSSVLLCPGVWVLFLFLQGENNIVSEKSFVCGGIVICVMRAGFSTYVCEVLLFSLGASSGCVAVGVLCARVREVACGALCCLGVVGFVCSPAGETV